MGISRRAAPFLMGSTLFFAFFDRDERKMDFRNSEIPKIFEILKIESSKFWDFLEFSKFSDFQIPHVHKILSFRSKNAKNKIDPIKNGAARREIPVQRSFRPIFMPNRAI